MKKTLIKTFSLLFLGMFLFTQAQFRNKDRQDRRQEQDSYQHRQEKIKDIIITKK